MQIGVDAWSWDGMVGGGGGGDSAVGVFLIFYFILENTYSTLIV